MINEKDPVRNIIPIFLLALFVLLLIPGCDSTEPNASRISLSFSTPTITNKISNDTITLDTVKILLKDIKLGFEKDSREWEDHLVDEDEINVKVGPFLVYLNLIGMTNNFAVSSIPEGTYNKIKFKIHKIEASQTPPDQEFKDGNNSLSGYSIIVKGNFNSQPFIYKSRKPAHQKIKLDVPLMVEANTSTNLTISVDPSTWFIKDGLLLDPNNPANQNDIDNSIKDSFKRCYKDDNYDGKND